jgi:ABC-type glutathione transport system ATPase component
MLALRDLRVAFGGRTVVHVDALDVGPGEIVGLVGESGSGKSMTTLATLGLAQSLGAHVSGSATFEGAELVGMSEQQLRAVRGGRIAMVFQAPVSSFNPLFRVGDVFLRALRLHGAGKPDARERARAAMQEVVLSPGLLERYPHELSGGQAQRVAIALAVALRARLLLADEPTSAVDVTVQAEILALLQRLRAEEGMAMLLVSHDLGVVSGLCDRVAIMHGGRIVEQGATASVLRDPRHEHTRELLASVPQLTRA